MERITLIITCCNRLAGLYVIDIHCSQQHIDLEVRKVLEEDCRGICKTDSGYALATNSSGLLVLNNDLQIVNRYTPERHMDYHGVAARGQMTYAVETAINSIGIYDLNSLSRVGAIRFSDEDSDVNHVNDIYVDRDALYVSMFSCQGSWRSAPVDSGVIVEYSLQTSKVTKVLYSGLKQPHSVTMFNNSIYYCDSGRLLVKQDDKPIFQSMGWTRGLAMVDSLVFIGQSHSRNTSITSADKMNISLDCGIHIFDRSSRLSTFLPLPSEEIYAILVDAFA
ncbi:MAG: TIGR03032 family protein [Alicyclobacillus sp.]|nr:TIGR03032 family protein [Alicyclobacillus sp.]